MNSQDPTAVFSRFRRTMLTDEYPNADAFFVKASELVPVVKGEFDGDLLEYEIFLLAGLLANMREIEELKRTLESMLDI